MPQTLTKKGSMRDVLTTNDPTTNQGSLAGTMAPASQSFLDQPAAAPAPGDYSPDDKSQPQTQAQKIDYESLDQHEPLSEDDWASLLHNLGSAMQKAHPDIEAALKQMSPDINYDQETAKLRQQIQNRPTEKAPGFAQSLFAHAGSPEGDRMMTEREDQVKKQAAAKQSDLESLQENVTMGHINDLARRGKFQEALATMLLQKGIGEAGARTRAQEALQKTKLQGQNALNNVQARAKSLADTFHFDERMRLKLLDISGKIANDKLQKYGGLDPVTGGFTIKPDQYEQWQDETMAEIYKQAADLRSHGVTGVVPGKDNAPQTNIGKQKSDPLKLR